MVNGKWEENDTHWNESQRDLTSGCYPYAVTLVKQTRKLTIIDGVGCVVTLTPQNDNKQVTFSRGCNSVTVIGLWTGVNTTFFLGPWAPMIEFTKTAEPATNPEIVYTGNFPEALTQNLYYQNASGEVIPIQTTFVGGVITIDLSGVPVGTTVK